MKSIKKLYQNFMGKEVPQDTRDELARRIDREAAARMKERGFGREQAKEAIFSYSPYARRQEREAAQGYLESALPEGMESPPGLPLAEREAKKTAADIYGVIRKAHAAEFELLYFAADKKAISSLLDIGFLPRDIYDVWQGNSLYAADLRDEGLTNSYEDRVRREVAEDRETDSLQEMDAAMKAYHQQAAARAHKFAGGTEDYALYHDGETAISLLLQEGFMPETVRDVFRKDIRDRVYLEKLMESCGKVKIAYLDIKNAPSLPDAASVADTYRAFAKRFMQRNGLSLLSFADERQIIGEMKEDSFPEEFLKRALLAASPVAKEPGRDAEQYVEALLADTAVLDSTLKKGQSRETFVQAGDIYMDFIDHADKYVRQRGNEKGLENPSLRTYYDCLAARKLILCHIPEKDILKTLKKLSANFGTVHDNYGYWMLEKATRILKKEQNLKQEAPGSIPEGKTLPELKAMGFDEAAIYRGILQERIDLNPSVEGRLYEEFLDKDMAETCLSRYPDFSKDFLLGAIKESPRAALLADTGLAEGKKYAEHVMREAERRIEEARGTRQEEKNLAYEFNRQRGLAYQGIEAKNADPAYQSGRSALQLMLMGYELLSIRKAILQGIAPHMSIEKPEEFADSILKKAQEVHARLMAVKGWETKEPETAEEEYMNRLHEKYEARKSVHPRMDIEIIRDMLLSGNFQKKEILSAVTSRSPIAVEPGRDATYVKDYLLPQAENEIVSAKDKLKAERPHPRENPSPDIHEEYAWQRAEIKNAIPCCRTPCRWTSWQRQASDSPAFPCWMWRGRWKRIPPAGRNRAITAAAWRPAWTGSTWKNITMRKPRRRHGTRPSSARAA